MTKQHFPKPYADMVARLRVPAGFLMAAAFLWLAAPSGASLAWGLPVALVGLGLRAWAAGHITKDRSLATSGPYAYMRNPLYVGTLLAAAGLAVASRSWGLGVVFAAVFLLVYLPAIELEQQHLRDLFPEYAEYAANVPMLCPRLRRWGGGGRFSWRQYKHNREYQALGGFLIAALWLAWRAWR